MFFCLCACVLKSSAKTASSKHDRKRRFFYVFNVFQDSIQDFARPTSEKIITGNPQLKILRGSNLKVCTHAEEISWNMFSMTRICQFLNTCMWKWPQSMLNVSKPWWREEISWLSHVVAYYPSNQPACALHSHLHRRLKSTAHATALPFSPKYFTPS